MTTSSQVERLGITDMWLVGLPIPGPATASQCCFRSELFVQAISNPLNVCNAPMTKHNDNMIAYHWLLLWGCDTVWVIYTLCSWRDIGWSGYSYNVSPVSQMYVCTYCLHTSVKEKESTMREIRLFKSVHVLVCKVCAHMHFLHSTASATGLFATFKDSVIVTILLQFLQQSWSQCVINRGHFLLYMLHTFVCIWDIAC